MARTSSNPAAAGFIVYGPQTALAVTLGDGTRILTLHPEHGAYLGELMQGATGPHKKDFNTRWVASMVADAYRILIRGGV